MSTTRATYTTAKPLPASSAITTHTLACGHCKRVIATRRGGSGAEERHKAHAWLMSIWRMPRAASGHPGILAVPSERVDGGEG